MKFCWTTIKVRNLEASLKFYGEIVGLPVTRRLSAGPGTEIAFLGDGETQLELMYHEGAEKVDLGKDISIGFEVESVEEKLAFVKERGFEVSGLFQPNPHVKFFYIDDPDGLKVQFVQNV